MTKVKLLDSQKTLQKIKRMAFEIYEQNFEEKEIIIAGIKGQGDVAALLIIKFLQEITQIKISHAVINIDKSHDQQSDIEITSDVDTFKNKVVVMVDDVLHTGRTLAFSLRPFLSIPLKKLQVAVLVDRGHHKYPISADFIGYNLATTLTDHIEVRLNEIDDQGVYLY
jgi:pyrimidine operon attenuation protein / uracil phosphoribosyltransferase